MNEDTLNVSVRKFLKKVGITSQREIEQAVRTAIASGRLKGNETLPAKVTLTVEGHRPCGGHRGRRRAGIRPLISSLPF